LSCVGNFWYRSCQYVPVPAPTPPYYGGGGGGGGCA
jgi:hypothetical protein